LHLSLDDAKEEPFKLFEEISIGEDKDILDYERAIIYYQKNETVRCEELLFRVM